MKKSNKIIVLVIVLLIIAGIGIFFLKNVLNQNSKEIGVSEALEEHLSKEENDIIKKIISTKPPVGAYLVEKRTETGDLYKEFNFISGDDRLLRVFPEKNLFSIANDEYFYHANSSKEKYTKKEVENRGYHDKNPEYNLEIGFFLSGLPDKPELIPGLKVYRDGDNYIVENSRFRFVFDKDMKRIEGEYQAQGLKTKEKLVDYDPDFDKYFNKYFEKLESYTQVSSYKELEGS